MPEGQRSHVEKREVVWHAARFVPDYRWNWECLYFSAPREQHASWWRRLARQARSLAGRNSDAHA